MGVGTETGEGGLERDRMESRKYGMGCNEGRKGPRENGEHLSVQIAPRGCLPKSLHSSAAKLAVKPTGKVNIPSHIYASSKQD